MKNICMALSFVISLAFAGTAIAAEKVEVKVNGMVCDFCAVGIQKVFGKKDEVKKVDVSLNEKLVTIDFKPEQSLPDDVIKEIITANGYTVVGIKRIEN